MLRSVVTYYLLRSETMNINASLLGSYKNIYRIYRSVFRQQIRGCHGEGNSSVVVEKLGAVTTIGLNRPEKRNCIDMETAKRLNDAFESFEADDNAVVGVLYGKGGNFCAGYDLQEVSSITDLNKIRDVMSSDLLKGSGPMGPTRRIFKKPVIAGVSGYAVAGGFELALACDLRVVEENAIMGVFNRRFGVPLIDGGTVRLPALIGLSRAMDLILTGRAINAKEALEWGLANRLVAVGTGLGQAVNLARSLTKFPQQCLLADRASAYEAALSPSTSFTQEATAVTSKFEVLKIYVPSLYYYHEMSFLDDYMSPRGSTSLLDDQELEEALDGASKFTNEGTGKHGKFHLGS